jgi:hypothetical protein
MSELWNIMLLVFTLTGALCWLCMAVLLVCIFLATKGANDERRERPT